LNHHKKIKAESSPLIPRTFAANLELLIIADNTVLHKYLIILNYSHPFKIQEKLEIWKCNVFLLFTSFSTVH